MKQRMTDEPKALAGLICDRRIRAASMTILPRLRTRVSRIGGLIKRPSNVLSRGQHVPSPASYA